MPSTHNLRRICTISLKKLANIVALMFYDGLRQLLSLWPIKAKQGQTKPSLLTDWINNILLPLSRHSNMAKPHEVTPSSPALHWSTVSLSTPNHFKWYWSAHISIRMVSKRRLNTGRMEIRGRKTIYGKINKTVAFGTAAYAPRRSFADCNISSEFCKEYCRLSFCKPLWSSN